MVHCFALFDFLCDPELKYPSNLNLRRSGCLLQQETNSKLEPERKIQCLKRRYLRTVHKTRYKSTVILANKWKTNLLTINAVKHCKHQNLFHICTLCIRLCIIIIKHVTFSIIIIITYYYSYSTAPTVPNWGMC